MTSKEIISQLPYKYPFLFVDELLSIDENSVQGTYSFSPELPFYNGHFIDNPITPGVILTETMAQIGLVCLGIYLLNEQQNINTNLRMAMSSSKIDYFLPVFPNEQVWVKSNKDYFRFNKLQCNVEMYNEKDQLVCRGSISGMLKV